MHRIGRTARLGAEGDAISFACERYAMSLPDIEAYIEQKIPSEPVTQELLTALPRTPREGVELQAEDGESIGEIFREVREARAAEDAKRGGGRSGGRSGGRGERSGPRSDSGERRERGPRPPRKPRVEGEVAAVAAVAPAAPVPAAAEGERPARKRRRRRGGKRLENGEAANAQLPQQAATQDKPAAGAAPVADPAGDKPSLLSRIGRGLKSLVTRAPRSQH